MNIYTNVEDKRYIILAMFQRLRLASFELISPMKNVDIVCQLMCILHNLYNGNIQIYCLR